MAPAIVKVPSVTALLISRARPKPIMRIVLAAAVLLGSFLAAAAPVSAHVLKKDCTKTDQPWVDNDPLDNGLLSSDPSALVVIGRGSASQYECHMSCFALQEISILYGCGNHY